MFPGCCPVNVQVTAVANRADMASGSKDSLHNISTTLIDPASPQQTCSMRVVA